ncbi:MAG: sucrose phosphorylase [Gammaproteobacteria bacterium]
MRNAVQLITYVDRLGGTLQRLSALLCDQLQGLFGGVHLLPFFDPIDGADAGFDPSDHTTVDKRLGNWSDVQELGRHTPVMADLIVNHVSSESPQFLDVIENGQGSDYWTLFLKENDVFEEASAERIDQLYRPRPGPPFTKIRLQDGTTVNFWTTFSERQIDINVETEQGVTYLEEILNTFAKAGVQSIRLDAAGYAIKREGTSCFMLPETFDFIGGLTRKAQALGMEVLVEIHAHFQTQIDIASRVSRVYDFALPPLVLHTLYTGDARALKNWLEISPRNCITVLDTHDGIGIVDAARDGNKPGLLSDRQLDSLVEQVHVRSSGDSALASGSSASNLDIYQLNTTYYDALGRSDQLYLIARAIQFFAPGIPQIYYVGLLGGVNDLDLLKQTGVGRDINRHYYDRGEFDSALASSMVRSLLDLIRLRNRTALFNAEFSLPDAPPDQLKLRWQDASDFIELHVNLTSVTATIEHSEQGTFSMYKIDESMRTMS